MAASSDLLSLAESHVGEDGTTFWDWYFGGGYVNGSSTPWCACFVSWCLDQLGVSCEGVPSSYVPSIQTAAADAGRALSPADAQPGDVLIFDWNGNGVGDHIGFCSVNHDGWMDTVEGNVSNSVGNRSRYWSNVLMAIRPDYSGDGGGQADPAPTPDSIGDLDGESGDLLIDGYFGPLTIKYVQSKLQAHGYYTGDLIDGDFGPLTKTELQKYLRYGVGTYQRNCDGDFAYYSALALQTHLKNLGYYFYTTDSGARDWCVLDGSWGTYTTKALQRALNSGRF